MAKKTAPVPAPSSVPTPIPGSADDMPRMISAKQVTIDPAFNARKSIDPKSVREIAASVKVDGQLHPVTVSEPTPGHYRLIAGFTRFAAICGPADVGGLARPEIMAKVIPGDLGAEDAKMINLAENMARRDLSTYDQGARYADLVHNHKMTGAKIASRVGLSPQYVNNLVNIVNKACPEIMARWESECLPEGSPNKPQLLVCNQQWLLKVIKLNNEEQVRELRFALGQPRDVEAGTGADGEGEAGSGQTAPSATVVTPANRAKLKHLTAAIDAAKEKMAAAKKKGDASEESRLAAVIMVLQFASGTRKDIRGVYSIPDAD